MRQSTINLWRNLRTASPPNSSLHRTPARVECIALRRPAAVGNALATSAFGRTLGPLSSGSLGRLPERTEMFRIDTEANTIGVTGMSEVEVPPALVVRRFGQPSPGDGFKVSGQYVFVDDKGQTFLVHDWKATNLWDPSFPGPEEYWSGRVPDELTISTKDVDPALFLQWFLDQLGWE